MPAQLLIDILFAPLLLNEQPELSFGGGPPLLDFLTKMAPHIFDGPKVSTGIREAKALQASNATFDLKMVDVRDSTNQ